MSFVPGRSRWTALPLALSLSLPLAALTATAASAEPQPEYRGYLTETATGVEYVVDDVTTGGRYFSSGRDSVDGSVRYLTSGPPIVAYVSEEPYGASSYVDRVHIVPPGGGDRVVYSAAAGTDLSEPVISPDGGTVLFAADSDRTSALLAVTIGSRAVTTVRSSTTTEYGGPSFSPDGSWISWAQQSARGSDLVQARFQTGAATVLAHADFPRWFDTAWSPTGDVLIAAFDEQAGNGDTVSSLSVVDTRTGTERVVLRGGSTGSEDTSYGEPAVAPDGGSVFASKAVDTADGTTLSAVRLPLTEGAFADPVTLPGYAGSISDDGPHAAETTPPGPVTDLAASVSGDIAHLTFTLPADRDVADVIVRRSEGEPSDTPTAGIEVTRIRTAAVDVPLPAADTDYGLSLFTRDWSGNLSPAAKITVHSPPPAAFTLSTPPARVVYRTAVRFTGVLSGAATGGQRVVLYARRALTSTPVAVAAATTAADGTFTLAATPSWTAEYTVRFAGNPTTYAAVSPKRVVSVVPVVSLALSTSRTTLGRTVTLAGSVAPSHAGAIVSLQRYVGGAWRTIASTRLSSTSSYRYVLKPSARGTWTLRMIKSADGDHLTAYSPTRTLSVG